MKNGRRRRGRTTLRKLYVIAVWAPLLFIFILESLRRWVTTPLLGPGGASVVFLLMAAGGIVLFARWIFANYAAARRRELRALEAAESRLAQIEGLRQASLALTSDLELDSVLQKVVNLSRQVVSARYGALIMLGESGQSIQRFIVSGVDEETKAKIGRLPQGKGLLGHVMADGKPLRLDRLGDHPASVGFPPNHPHMNTFLGVPLVFQDKVLGHLYLTEKESGPFTAQDQTVVEQFALYAAVAITNAQLYRQVEHLAVLEERERIGMDLHDGTIQSLYALGLVLEDIAERPDSPWPDVQAQLYQAVDTVSRIIGDIRHYIFDLKLPLTPGEPLRHQVAELLAALQPHQSLTVLWQWDDQVEEHLTDRQLRTNLLHIFREALSNVIKHAGARQVVLQAALDDQGVLLAITDDGRGFDPDAVAGSGRGLGNMETRAYSLGGRLAVKSSPGQGTIVELHLPVQAAKEAQEA